MSRTERNHDYSEGSLNRIGLDAWAATDFGSHAPALRSNRRGSRIAALHIEFVAKPEEASRVHLALPSALQNTFEEVAGFAGSLVMISNHEARLVTVVALWAGEERVQRCHENVRWVRALLNPYMDRCLRVQTLATYLPDSNGDRQECNLASAERNLETQEFSKEAVYAA